jgi:hypothetical protein
MPPEIDQAPAVAPAVPAPTADGPNATRLVAGIIDDATKLISQQVAMFRAELRQDFQRTVDAGKLLGVGSLVASVGALFLAVSLVHGLAALFPTWPAWACWAAVGGTFVVAGIVALAVGQARLRRVAPLPDQTFAALQENVSWITKPQK